MKRFNTQQGIRFFNSLSLRIFLFFLVIIIGLFTVYSTICSGLQKHILEDTIQLSAFRAGDLIYKSLYRLMLLNDQTNLLETISIIGNEPGMERIRIYNKNGTIKYSSLRNEMGMQVDMQAEACYVCHSIENPKKLISPNQKSRIFRSEDNRRVLGLILPIHNAPECSNAACHAHPPEKSVLGVLDVQMSLGELDAAISHTRRTMYGISVAFLLLGMVLIGIVVYVQTYRPINILKQGTERLAAGEMEYRIPLHRSDELGLLAKSFNHMAENLKQAYQELREWSETLEQRIKEKTREMEEINREMLHVERMASLGKMAATVAHELNNPLSGIVNYARLIQKKTERMIPESTDRQEITEQLELIRSEALRCGNIVRDLLIFARGSHLNLQRCRLEDIIKRALNLVSHHIHFPPFWENLVGDLQKCIPYHFAHLRLNFKLQPFLNRERHQYHSTLILKKLLTCLPDDGEKILGITNVDIFIPIFTFLFGGAQLNGTAALISTYRLGNEFYGLPRDDALLYQRTLKEALHELGHTLGLTHCDDYRCVMHASTYVENVDLKVARFCSECQQLLGIECRT